MSLGTIHAIERGERLRFQEESIVRVCSVLQQPLTDIVDEGVVARGPTQRKVPIEKQSSSSPVVSEEAFVGLFLAAPMATLKRSYARRNSAINAIAKALEGHCKIKRVYYAGRALSKPSDFEDEAAALRANLTALDHARRFLLVYPEPLPTSALVELGYAMARKIPIIICIHDWAHLPYMLRSVSRVCSSIAVVKYRTMADIVPLVLQEHWYLEG